MTQFKKKVEYYESHSGKEYDEGQAQLLAERLRQVEELEAEFDGELGELPDAKTMLEDLGLEDVYSLFRWESDPTHASSVALGQTVAKQTEDHVHLGERNKPWDRVKRIGSTLLLLQHAGNSIFAGLGFDVDEWDVAAREAEGEIEAICTPYYKALEEEPL